LNTLDKDDIEDRKKKNGTNKPEEVEMPSFFDFVIEIKFFKFFY
jgi:hypothetical protein